ncbi:MAG TPA: hypothetical protein VKW76_13455 [Candidatus Binatia bacterium]|nr:hypothetical protein [Candidatus Binatia bacterium]
MRTSGLVLALGFALLARGGGAAEVDPTMPGPYPVGFTRMTFVKASVTTGEPRVLDTWIWYPAVAGTGSASGALLDGAAVRPGRWPLLMFSHGSCGFPGQSAFLTAALASWGVIVAAPPHPGNTTFDGIPQCSQPAVLVDSFANRVPDVQFVLTKLLEEDGTPGSRFARRISRKRIGMSGHSFGGQTTLRVTAVDPRVRAGLALAPAAIPGLTIRKPLLVYTGSLDSLVPFDTAAQASYAEATGIRFLVRLEDAGHCAFIPVCIPLLCGSGCPPVGIPQADANHLALRYAVPFVLRYVARRPGFTRLLEPASEPPGVTVVDAVLRR